MEIIKMVRIEDQEVHIDISGEDAVAAIFEENQEFAPVFLLKRVCNNMAGFFNHIPDALIEALTDEQRELISGYFSQQAERFKVKTEIAE